MTGHAPDAPAFFGIEAWILATLAAVLFQTARFAVQKQLTLDGMSALATTWTRFLWSTPLLTAAFVIWLLTVRPELPAFSARFWLLASIGGLAQILGTACLLLLFRTRAFATGLTFKKSEALQTGLLGWLALGDRPSAGGVCALMAGFASLIVLSASGSAERPGARLRSAGLGLMSGALFAVAGVAVRGAILAIDAPTVIRAALALVATTTLQTTFLGLWFLARDRAQVRSALRAWRPGLAVSLLSLLGSFGWFMAFALQNAAYVFALGQVELVFASLIGLLFFGEKPERRELLGMALLAASLIALVTFA